ncbi:MAG: Kiwa anti-phage protein KwaB-like domain-containing protein [Terriglobales bacterium]
MKINFDFHNVTITDFGVGHEDGDGQSFVLIPVDPDVQVVLQEMAIATREEMNRIAEGDAPVYEPSEKYGSCEYVHLDLTDEMAEQLRLLHQAKNLPSDAKVLDDPSDVFCYFARMADGKGHRLTGVRRAAQFKGVLKSRLLRLTTDALRIVDDKVFKLDTDFDMLIDNSDVHILRPSGFEFVGKLQGAVLAAAPENIKLIKGDLPFVDFASIEDYACKHPRAARHLASIRVQKETKDVDKAALKKLCKRTGVKIQDANGKITVDGDQVMGFLEVLDRRRYHLELVKNSSEYFKAGSRRKIGNVSGEAGA